MIHINYIPYTFHTFHPNVNMPNRYLVIQQIQMLNMIMLNI